MTWNDFKKKVKSFSKEEMKSLEKQAILETKKIKKASV